MTLFEYANELFTKTDFFVSLCLSYYYKKDNTISSLLEQTGFPRSTVTTSLERLTSKNLITREHEGTYYRYAMIERIEVDQNQFDVLMSLNKDHSRLMTPNACRLFCVLLSRGAVNINDLINQLGWIKASVYQTIKKLKDNGLIELSNDGKNFILTKALEKTVVISEGSSDSITSRLSDYLRKKISYDIKQYYFPEADSMDRIMRFYRDSNRQAIENKSYNFDVASLYDLLGWGAYEYFDILHSFWNLFSYGLHQINPETYFITESKNIRNVYKTSAAPYYQTYQEKYFDKNEPLRKDNTALQEKYPRILELAEKTHAVINCVPVPDGTFNEAKGFCGVGDCLALMLAKIEDCISQGKSLGYTKKVNKIKTVTINIEIETLIEWKHFYADNRRKFGLEAEYSYDQNEDKLIPHLLFDTQSLENPLPGDEKDYDQCLAETLRRMGQRGETLVANIIKAVKP